MYRYINQEWRRHWKTKSATLKQKAIEWRLSHAVTRVEKPLRLDRARAKGYKAKQGVVVVRVRVGRGGMRKKRPNAGRRPKHLGTTRIKAAVSMQEVAERRAMEKYPNLRAIGSYILHRDGKYQWFEVIMIDPHHPSIMADKDLSVFAAKAA